MKSTACGIPQRVRRSAAILNVVIESATIESESSSGESRVLRYCTRVALESRSQKLQHYLGCESRAVLKAFPAVPGANPESQTPFGEL